MQSALKNPGGEGVFFAVQKGGRHGEGPGEHRRHLEFWFVDAAFVLVDSRTRHRRIEPRQLAQARLRQTRTLTGFEQAARQRVGRCKATHRRFQNQNSQ